MTLPGGVPSPQLVNISLFDDGTETVLVIESTQEAMEQLRWSARFPARADACWHLERFGILPSSIVDAIRRAEPCHGLVGMPGYVRDPKTTLRYLAMSALTRWH